MAQKNIQPATNSRTIDIRNATFEGNFCSKAPSRAIRSTRDDQTSGMDDASRRQLYRYARHIAGPLHLERIIEVSRRPSEVFSACFVEESLDLYGVYQQPILPKSKRSRVSVRECHLDHYPSTENCLREFEDDIPTLYILVDALEYIHDPRPILGRLRANLMRHPDSRAIVPTPAGAGRPGPDGLPADKARIRQWDPRELADLMATAGFKIEASTDAGPDNPAGRMGDCPLVLSCSDEYYSRFLTHNGLPEPSSYLIVMSENAGADTGWIVRYVREIESVLTNKPIVLFAGKRADLPGELKDEWICPEQMVRVGRHGDMCDAVLDAFAQLVFYYGGGKLVEIQDYLGHGYRIAQAKRAGLLPPDILIKVRCHGSLAYRDFMRESWTSLTGLEALYREKELIEKADLVSFPSRFSKDIYIERGYEIGTRAEIEPYCFTFSEAYAETAPDIGRLVFYDGLTSTGNYGLFVDTLRQLNRKGLLRTKIHEAVYISPGVSYEAVAHRRLKDLGTEVKITYYRKDWSGCLALMTAARSESLCILLHGADEALPVLELIDSCRPFVATDSGSISEVVPAPHRAHVVTDNTAERIADSIAGYLEMDNDRRKETVNGLKRQAAVNQKKIHTDFSAKIGKATSRGNRRYRRQTVSGDLVSVIVPLFNPQSTHLAELSMSLNNQTVRPKEVIFVDDGSEATYMEGAVRTITSTLEVPWRIIRQRHGGASAAKNSAWRSAHTKYVVALDSDNMLLPDFIYKTVSCIENNPNYAVVTSYIGIFNDGKDYENQASMRIRFKPRFASIILGQSRNDFGDNTGCYRRDVLERVGGWDEYGTVKAGDWALYMNLTCRGYKIAVINQVLALYRLREDSAGRTMNKYVSDSCIARNTACLPRFEAYSLFGLCRHINTPENGRALGKTLTDMARNIVARLRPIPILGEILLKFVSLVRGRN